MSPRPPLPSGWGAPDTDIDTEPAPTPPDAADGHGPVSFEELFESRYDDMVRVAGLIVLSRARAEEIVQDAYAKVYVRWQKVDNPAAYLRTTVVNLCRNEIRRREMIRRRSAQLRPLADASQPVGDEMFDALAALPAKRRAAIVLRYYLDLPEREIAEMLGCRPGTVKSLLHRGLAQLRESLEDNGNPGPVQ